jgi:hypothetical protein
MLNAELGVGCSNSVSKCNSNVCPKNPDFCIKKNDTMPAFRISVDDCDGVVDLTDDNLVLEASMWFEAKLKNNINDSETIVQFADGMGFDQISINDIIVAALPRNPEIMLVTGIDESSKSIIIQRGHAATTAQSLQKGTILRVFKLLNLPAHIESVFEEVTQVDGSTQNELTETFLVFNWQEGQTSLAGCYWFEFKLMMISSSGDVLWTKTMPATESGFLVNIIDSATPNV